MTSIDWLAWRLVFSDKIQTTYTEICTTWSLEDIMQANDILDSFEESEARAYKKLNRR